MENMDAIISEAIEQSDNSSYHLQARDVLREIKDAEKIIADLQMRIVHLKETIISSLGSEIRQRQPKMSIGLNNGTCRAGYRSMGIDVKPDLEKGLWIIDGGRSARRFVKRYPHLSKMTDDMKPLAHAIADYFADYYKSL